MSELYQSLSHSKWDCKYQLAVYERLGRSRSWCQAEESRETREGAVSTVPGLQAAYEPPEQPDLDVAGDHESPEQAAQRVIEKLIEKQYLQETAQGCDVVAKVFR